MDVSHNFRFCWNDHVPHLSQIFSDLRFEEVYCDTTLISDDGFVMKAHGAVLSATSRYFERVLSDVTSDQHPIIVLKGANFVELSCLLDYIYQGVTQVDQHLMESVLDVADMLEIKGLSKMKNNLSIKKLIAPSPTSSVVSRNSPLCSSPSKSPPPPSHASQSHSLSCPSSPNDTYAAPSAMFKMDTDDQSELNELNQKGKHTTFPDSRPPISSRLMDNHEYEANPPKQSSCSNSEYLDQTLGIDLSLSRATNDDNERASVKNFNLYEDSHLRKKKIMKKFEEVNPSFPDLEWDKVGEKVEETVPLKKKKLYSRSENDVKAGFGLCSQVLSESQTEMFSCREDSQMRQYFYFNDAEEKSLLQGTSYDEPHFQSDLTSENENDFQIDSEYYGETDVSESYMPVPSDRPSSSSTVRYIKQNPYLLTSQISKERSCMNRPLCLSQSHETASAPNDSSGQEMPQLCSMSNAGDKILTNGGRAQNTDEECPPQFLNNDITDFVSVKICQPDASRNLAFKSQDFPEDAYSTLHTKIKRPSSQVKRPLSKYTLYMKETYPKVAAQNPGKKSAELIKIISASWRNMPPEQKQSWEDRASELHREFKIRHPDYVYNSKRFQGLKFDYYRQREERRNLFRITPSPHADTFFHQPI